MRIFITGCSSGIGRALAIEFSSQGHEVLATARSLDSIKDLEAAHSCRIACVDVNAPATLSAALNSFGHPVDVCIANAGASAFGPLLDQNVAIVESIMRTNVLGVVATAQAVVPHSASMGYNLHPLPPTPAFSSLHRHEGSARSLLTAAPVRVPFEQ